jgi:hypothetical protein
VLMRTGAEPPSSSVSRSPTSMRTWWQVSRFCAWHSADLPVDARPRIDAPASGPTNRRCVG